MQMAYHAKHPPRALHRLPGLHHACLCDVQAKAARSRPAPPGLSPDGRAPGPYSSSPLLLLRNRVHKKKGPPTMAVMMPMGSSAGARMLRDTRSQTTRKQPPSIKALGNRTRWLQPNQRRQRCGAIMPTKPMGPVTDTMAPTMTEETAKAATLVWRTATPPARGQLLARSQQIQLRSHGADEEEGGHDDKGQIRYAGRHHPGQEPMSQRMMRWVSWASLQYWMNMTRLEKKKLMITPAKSITGVEKPPRARVIR